MAIKPISKLDPYLNGASDVSGNVGGSIHLYEVLNKNDLTAVLSDPRSHKDEDQFPISFEEHDFYNLLFEVSKPIDSGAQGINSNEYSSYKLTYEDLIQNIIVDTKQWLNARNNLGDFDLCALAYRDYAFDGKKTFGGDIELNKALTVIGRTSLSGALRVGDNTYLEKSLRVGNNISCVGNLSAGNGIYANGALYAQALSSDRNGTTVNPGNNGFVVQNVLSGKSGQYLNVNVSTNITGDTYINGKLNVSQAISGNGGLYITGDNVSAVIACDLDLDGHSISAGECTLTASAARWSDLAEYYLGDKHYEPGTLIKFGGENEVTIAGSSAGEVNGVVTTKPAYLMNSRLKDDPLGCAVALAGRVPVKVIGKVKKFDSIVLSDVDGVGAAVSKADLKRYKDHVIGRALEASDDESVKLVECVVRFTLG